MIKDYFAYIYVDGGHTADSLVLINVTLKQDIHGFKKGTYFKEVYFDFDLGTIQFYNEHLEATVPFRIEIGCTKV